MRHALALEPEDLIGLAAGRDPELRGAVEHGDLHFHAERQLREGHRQVAVEVGAVPREDLVLADAHEDVQVTGRPAVGAPGALAAQPELHPVLDARRDLHGQQALGALTPLAPAPRAGVAVQLTRALAPGAGLRHSEEAVRAPDLAAPAAEVARLEPAARLDAGPAARVALLEPRDLNLRLDARRRLLERDLELVLEVLGARGAGAGARARAAREEVLEDVLEQRAEARVPPACGGTHRAEPVEVRALLGVGQDGVRLADLLEALLAVLVARVAIGVVLHRELPVGLLQLGVRRAAWNAEDLVIVARHGLRRPRRAPRRPRRARRGARGRAAGSPAAARSRRCWARPPC